MAHVVFTLIAVTAGSVVGFVFGCSHSNFFTGLFKGLFIGGVLALDVFLCGGSSMYCWCLLGASAVGSMVAAITPDENPVKRYFDLRRPIDF